MTPSSYTPCGRIDFKSSVNTEKALRVVNEIKKNLHDKELVFYKHDEKWQSGNVSIIIHVFFEPESVGDSIGFFLKGRGYWSEICDWEYFRECGSGADYITRYERI